MHDGNGWSLGDTDVALQIFGACSSYSCFEEEEWETYYSGLKQDKGGQLLHTPYWGEILKLPWEDKGALGRYQHQWYWEEIMISSLMPFTEKKEK